MRRGIGHGAGVTSSLFSVAAVGIIGFVLVGNASGCFDAALPPLIIGVSPDRAYTDGSVYLRVAMQRVRPGLRAQVGAGDLTTELASVAASLILEQTGGPGEAPVPLTTADWDGGDQLWVKTPVGLGAGRYRLRLVDPRGHSADLPYAFESLGGDPAAPTLTCSLHADAYVGAGKEINAAIFADDDMGGIAQIHWEVSSGASGDCPTATAEEAPENPRAVVPSSLTCVATFQAPELDSQAATFLPLGMKVVARDRAGNESSLDIPLRLARPPVIDAFSGRVGALGGYQPFVVRGQYFLPGTQAFIGGLAIVGREDGGDLLDEQTIVGWTPPHNRAEDVSVEVRSPAGLARTNTQFSYAAPPRPRDIQPALGPTRGAIRVTVRGNDFRPGVIVYVGATRETRQPLLNATFDLQSKVIGCLPPGAGLASVWAYDPVTGDGELPAAFTYDDSAVLATIPPEPCP